MPLRIDRFSWIVLGLVAVVLVVAVVTANMTGGDGWGELTYLDENSPEAAVYNAFVAFSLQDSDRADQLYTERALEQHRQNQANGRPLEFFPYRDDTPRRLRILEVTPVGSGAQVTFAIDRYSSGGPFGSGNTWTDTRTIRVAQENGIWKIDEDTFYF